MLDGMDKVIEKSVDRRSFLRGSALFAAALGLGVASVASAQEQKPEEQKPADPFAEGDNSSKGESETKLDKDGREYRVCPQCGANMYRQGRTWTCENCGYSYVE